MKIEAGVQVTPNVRLLRPLGEGGMGAVWVAEHLTLGTEVAVKFLHGEFAKDEATRDRFSREAAAASQVKSAHVVKIYDYGITDTDVPFIVMEMLEGTELSKRIESERRLPPKDVVTIVTQLCRALERAHEKGVVHRDIKPENVFLANEGGDIFVKLLDFGIAKTDASIKKSSHRSTMANESFGTPFYMSPEQFRSAKQIDSRSDLWSVGVLAYEALTGQLPFQAETVSALAILVNEGKTALPSTIEPSLPAAVDAWFAKACAHDPADRFASARELAEGLQVAFGAPAGAVSSGAHGRVVISQLDVRELGDAASVSMRDTAFATDGGSASGAPARSKVGVLIGAGAVLVAIAGAMAWRVHERPREAAKPAPTSSSVTSAIAETPSAPRASVEKTHDDAPSPSSSVSTVASTPPHASATRTPPKASAMPAASGAPKGKHDDIW